MEPKGAKRGPKGAKREPIGAKRSNGTPQHLFLEPFWEPFPLKDDEQIDAEIDAENVLDIYEQMMQKWSRN